MSIYYVNYNDTQRMKVLNILVFIKMILMKTKYLYCLLYNDLIFYSRDNVLY